MKRKRRRCIPDHRGGEDESAKKANSTPYISDDVLLSIFSRLSTRDAFRCAAALSKRHRQLIAGVDFWLLHRRRLNPPPPRPNMAYMVTVVEPRPASDRPPAPLLDLALPRCAFLDFHLAGDGDDGGGLRYSLVDRAHLRHRYAGTCNGVILLAPKTFNNGGAPIVLFNPAAAGSEVAVRMELPDLPANSGRYRVAGFGYGASSGVHRVLVTREERVVSPDEQAKSNAAYRAKELLSYTLDGGGADHRRLRSVLPELGAKKIGGKPVFLDGKVYVLANHSRVLAFDADDETVSAIELPGERSPGKKRRRHARSKLMEVSGRLCVATGTGDDLSLWLLAADREWVRLCEVRWRGAVSSKLAGAWDCGGVVLLHHVRRHSKTGGYLHMHDTRNDEAFKRLPIPRAVAEQGGSGSGRVMCWGYRPTLVSPGSIAGAPPRRGGVLAAAALDPMLQRDVEAGRERTLETVCFMNLLLYITRKLPDDPLDVINEIKRKSLPFSLR